MGLTSKKQIMFENFGLFILSYFFLPFLKQERERKEWIEKQVKMLTNCNKRYKRQSLRWLSFFDAHIGGYYVRLSPYDVIKLYLSEIYVLK